MTNYSTLPIMGIRSHLVTEMATNHDRNQPVLKIERGRKKQVHRLVEIHVKDALENKPRIHTLHCYITGTEQMSILLIWKP